jgi:hypothetical protein
MKNIRTKNAEVFKLKPPLQTGSFAKIAHRAIF